MEKKSPAMILGSLILFVFSVISASEIDDLRELINERVKAASNFVPPIDNSVYRENDTSQIYDYGIFDFIVVGAGSSGAIIANRLSENPNWSILIIEAGTSEDNFSTIPGLYQYLSKSDRNWNYKTTPQNNACFGFADNKCPIITGRSLGGSSATFEPFYIRGNSRNFDEWAALGNPDWSFKNVLPYFKKIENSLDIKNSSYHGYGGDIPTTFPNPQSGLYKLFRDASEDDGLTEIDYNGESQIGVSKPQLNVQNGRRASTSKLLTDTNLRMNVNLTLNAFVTKLLFNDTTTHGVQFNKNGRIYQALVKYEVILAAGAVNTAALLLRSGIGPKDELEKHKIKLIQDLDVGVNYSDHLIYPGIFFRTPIESGTPSLDDLLDEYVNRNRDLLAKPLGADGVSFYKYPHSDDNPFVEFLFIPQNGYNSELPIVTMVNYTEEVTEKLFREVNVTTDLNLLIYLFDVQSKGKISLKSDDPFEFPNIDASIFNNLQDLLTLEKAIERTLALVQSQSFLPYEAFLVGSVEACREFPLHSMDYWYCSMRVLCFPANHITGTTPMGNHSGSVVDERLRIYGVKGMRIADPGVIPVSVSGHTNAISMMLGEKAADIIKEDYYK